MPFALHSGYRQPKDNIVLRSAAACTEALCAGSANNSYADMPPAVPAVSCLAAVLHPCASACAAQRNPSL